MDIGFNKKDILYFIRIIILPVIKTKSCNKKSKTMAKQPKINIYFYVTYLRNYTFKEHDFSILIYYFAYYEIVFIETELNLFLT